MAISSDYPRPITVNGFICRNCNDVSDAKKFIDPSGLQAGKTAAGDADPQRAVRFGGALASLSAASISIQSPIAVSDIGQRYDKVA